MRVPRFLALLATTGCTAALDSTAVSASSGPAADVAPHEGSAADTPSPPSSSSGAAAPGAAPCTPIGSTPHVRLCRVTRLGGAAILAPGTTPGVGKNFQGPSVIRAPAWLPNRLGDYYMYFAAHDGSYIRLAYANAPEGPFTIHAPGTLSETQVAPFSNTIASPDVHSLGTNELRMYFHTDQYPGSSQQWSGVATSTDGVRFTLASTKNLAKYYLRVFEHDGKHYGLQKGWSTAPAELGVSPDGIAPFTFVKTFAQGSVRHFGILRKGDVLLVFYSRIGDTPERIYLSTIDLRTAPDTWDLVDPVEVLRPETTYEGATFPATPSLKGPATNVNELRDPFPFEDGGRTFLYYTVAGESGIAVAEIGYETL